jgi:hypothetical protein
METLTYGLSRWTTEELLDEVVKRTATDGPGLQLLETIVIRARLAESDHRLGRGKQQELTAAVGCWEVGGTTEMGLAGGQD